MGVGRWIGTGAVGLAGAVLARTAIGRAAAAGTVAYRVWKDPKVQKVRRKVVAKLKKQRATRTSAR
jgi:predicted secreted Zn-dependent protease